MNGYEKDNLERLRPYLAECTVLLKKNGAFPLDAPCRIFAAGSGVRDTVKGGTGSGDVNSRIVVNVEQGLKNAGMQIMTEGWLTDYDRLCEEHMASHMQKVMGIMKEKGVDELFDAAKKLKGKYGDKIKIDLVGFFEDEYKETVNQLAADGIVAFHGFQEEPRPFYAAAHCIVLPSYHEGMSNVLLEAAATGRALIASDIPGCREAVDDGVNGFICKGMDSESLAKCMDRFMLLDSASRKAMGMRGRRKMEEVVDRNMVVNETLTAIAGETVTG